MNTARVAVAGLIGLRHIEEIQKSRSARLRGDREGLRHRRSQDRRGAKKPLVIDIVMQNEAVPTAGHWNIMDIYSPGTKVHHVSTGTAD